MARLTFHRDSSDCLAVTKVGQHRMPAGHSRLSRLYLVSYEVSAGDAGARMDGRSICTEARCTAPEIARDPVAVSNGRQQIVAVMPTFNRNRSAADLPNDSDAWPVGPVLDHCPHQPYGEEAFRYFLSLERKRAERSRRSLLLLMVTLTTDSNRGAGIPGVVSDKLFSALSLCVRDVDFIGWYRRDRVAAAVLTQGADSPAFEAAEQIRLRVTELLSERLPVNVSRRLHVRVLQARRSERS